MICPNCGHEIPGRSGEEIRQAIAIIGASFIGPQMRRHVWGNYDQEAGKAWAMFQALGWVAGADDSDFNQTLEYIALKMTEYAENERNREHVNP